MAQENFKQVKQPVRHKLNYPHFEYVVNNCRVADELECMLMGYTKKNLLQKFNQLEDGVTGTYLSLIHI